jgi:hypothetical protein
LVFEIRACEPYFERQVFEKELLVCAFGDDRSAGLYWVGGAKHVGIRGVSWAGLY